MKRDPKTMKTRDFQWLYKLVEEHARAEVAARMGVMPKDTYANTVEMMVEKLDELREYLFGTSDLVELADLFGIKMPTPKKEKKVKSKKKTYSKKKKYSKKKVLNIRDQENAQVSNLTKKLKKETDPAEKRKLRRQLRKLGHSGGTR